MYLIQIFNLFSDCLLVKTWGLPSLNTTVGSEIEKSIGYNCFLSFMKISVLSLDN